MRQRVNRQWREMIQLTCLIALAATVGCASVDVTQNDRYQGEKLPRPDRIIVHDFAATPADLPSWSEASTRFAGENASLTPDELEAGRTLGTLVATNLVARIEAMGLTANRAAGQPGPRDDDIVLVGYFTSIDEGSKAKRMMLGFGSGAPELTTHIEGYRMTDRGLVKLGSGGTSSGSGKSPGMILGAVTLIATANPIGLVVGGVVKGVGEVSGSSAIEGAAERTADEIADVLQQRFQEQGWIGR